MAEEKKQKNSLPDRFVTVQAPTTYSGTIKKAMAFVSKSPIEAHGVKWVGAPKGNTPNSPERGVKWVDKSIEAHGVKGMKSTPWRKTFKTPEHLDKWVDANQAEVHATREIEKGIIKPDLKPTLKPEAKEALKDWYRNVYKKSFSYECPGCGHKDTVSTSGFGVPKEYPCRGCNKKTSNITVHEDKPSPRMTDDQWKKYKSTEKPLFGPNDKPFPKLVDPKLRGK